MIVVSEANPAEFYFVLILIKSNQKLNLIKKNGSNEASLASISAMYIYHATPFL